MLALDLLLLLVVFLIALWAEEGVGGTSMWTLLLPNIVVDLGIEAVVGPKLFLLPWEVVLLELLVLLLRQQQMKA